MQRALDDRLLLSEAVEHVARLVDGFPTAPRSPGYLGALSEILTTYPRSIALACTDRIGGVARETKFPPTIADIVGWCEPRVHAMRCQFDAVLEDERRIQRELEEKAEEERLDPIIRARVGEKMAQLQKTLKEKMDDVYAEARKVSLAKMERATDMLLKREYKASRLEPVPDFKNMSSGDIASPDLRRLMQEKANQRLTDQ